jgi:hypothetical protein
MLGKKGKVRGKGRVKKEGSANKEFSKQFSEVGALLE